MKCKYHQEGMECDQMREVNKRIVCIASACPEYPKLKGTRQYLIREMPGPAQEGTDIRLIALSQGGRR